VWVREIFDHRFVIDILALFTVIVVVFILNELRGGANL